MRRWSVALLSWFLSTTAYAQFDPETEITILGVLLPGANAQKAQYFLNDIQSPIYWTWGVTATVANGGLPITMPAGSSTSTPMSATDALIRARADAIYHNIRGAADVILYFANSFTSGPNGIPCGQARQINWTVDSGVPIGQRWNPGPTGLDLNGAQGTPPTYAEASFEAIIATQGGCNSLIDTAIHELGHLLGAGHEVFADPTPDLYLNLDSHAAVFTGWAEMFPGFIYYYTGRTIVSQDTTAEIFMRFWADPGNYTDPGGGYVIPSSANNRGTVEQTALSVANYRQGVYSGSGPTALAQCSDGFDNDGNALTDYPQDPGCASPTDETESIPQPPSCSLTPPVTVGGSVSGYCVPLPWTSHVVWWIDACPTASTHYELWYRFAPDAYNYGWSIATPIDEVFVKGGDAEVKVRSCNGAACSALSAQSYLAYSQC